MRLELQSWDWLGIQMHQAHDIGGTSMSVLHTARNVCESVLKNNTLDKFCEVIPPLSNEFLNSDKLFMCF